MTDKTKKIIAREGLILIGVVALSIVVYILYEVSSWYVCKFHNPFDEQNLKSSFDFIQCLPPKLRDASIVILIFGYPIYLLMRFIIWAVKTIKIPSINIENKLSVKANISGIQNNVAENMEKIADDMVIGSNKKTNITTIYNTTQNFYLKAIGYTIQENKIPEIEERAKEVVLGSAEALKKIPEEKVKSLFYDIQELYNTSAIASGTSTGAIIRNADYIFKGEGHPTFEVKFIPPSLNANVFDIKIPPEHKDK